MYTYRTIDAPDTRAAALDRIAELQRMFVFRSYVLVEVTHPDGRDDVDILSVDEDDDGEHKTIGAAIGAHIESCEARRIKVWNIDEIPRPPLTAP